MMKHLPEWPAPLLRKWLLSSAIGLGCLLVGIIMYFALDDIRKPLKGKERYHGI